MVYIYDENAGAEFLEIHKDRFAHLKARRVKDGDRIDIRNLKDGYNYIYEINSISKKSMSLNLVFKNSLPDFKHELEIAWAVVEPCVIEKTLPSLNEMGVGKILFVYTEFSQKNIKLDIKRFERILIQSSQQCGRNSITEFEIYNSCDELLKVYDKVSLVDFAGKSFNNAQKDEILFIGPEGGFSQTERGKFKNSYALNSKYILRSNTAVLAVAGKILL